MNSPKKTPTSMMLGVDIATEDDLAQSADLDELEQLSDFIMKFEHTAFYTKKKVNAIDRITFKSQLLPPTLKLCYQALMQSWMLDTNDQNHKPDFDQDNLELLVSEAVKQSGICIKEFTKFKGEFYALNEPIINKDISNLSLNFVQAQINKQ